MTSRDLGYYRERYRSERFVFIPGVEMRQILASLGADFVEEPALQEAWRHLPADPTLEYRRSRNGRFLVDLSESRICRLEHQGFRLSKDEDFMRHDSGMVRTFAPIAHDIQDLSIVHALFRFKVALIRDQEVRPRPCLKKEHTPLVSTAFALRTMTGNGLVGEPAAEGVHSDGVEHTLTMLIACSNMTSDSAVSTLHHNSELTGVHTAAADEALVAGRVRHADPFDTLVIVDTELKHSLTQLKQKDTGAFATRDMLILFTRRPCEPGHPSFDYDSLSPNLETPLSFDL